MKAHLMHPSQDFSPTGDLPPDAGTLAQDLELETLWQAMADGDEFLYATARRAVLLSLTEPEVIRYRQRVLADCLAHPAPVRNLYDIATATVEGEKKAYFGWSLRDTPDTILTRALAVLEFFTGQLRILRAFAEENLTHFTSEGLTQLLRMLPAELSDSYFQEIEDHLGELKFHHGALISAQLGAGNKGTGYVLRKPAKLTWRDRLSPARGPGYSFYLAERDDSGLQALSELHGRGVNLAANALAQSADHILGFFRTLRSELAFYLGCLNLHQHLTGKGEPVCFPDPADGGDLILSASGLYDPCLSLHLPARAVGSDLAADGKPLLMITGANQGGKSTFLRSLGLAQLMTQCGMLAPAHSFRTTTCTVLFTHYKREEDAGMKSGKLDEELARMSGIIDRVTPGSIVLCNESFASTNEREGSQIALDIIRALLDCGVRVYFVTHLFDLAHRLHTAAMPTALFLRADRHADGSRTFQIAPGEPRPTSYGADIYQDVFQKTLDRTA